LLHIISLYSATIQSTKAGEIEDIHIYASVLEPTCKNLHIGHDTAKRIFDVWAKHADQLPVTEECLVVVLEELTTHEQRGRKPLPNNTALLSSQHILAIAVFIDDRLRKGTTSVAADIVAHLQKLDVDPVTVSRDVIRRVMKSMGYVSENRKATSLYDPCSLEKAHKRVRDFIVQYSAACRDPDKVSRLFDALRSHLAGDGVY